MVILQCLPPMHRLSLFRSNIQSKTIYPFYNFLTGTAAGKLLSFDNPVTLESSDTDTLHDSSDNFSFYKRKQVFHILLEHLSIIFLSNIQKNKLGHLNQIFLSAFLTVMKNPLLDPPPFLEYSEVLNSPHNKTRYFNGNKYLVHLSSLFFTDFVSLAFNPFPHFLLINVLYHVFITLNY